LAGAIKPVKVRHGRVERKEIVERQRRRRTVKPERVVTTQLDPIWISDRRHGGEPVECAAQHDGEEARIPPLRARDLRYERPGEQRA
jgi:hypothetical protein